MEIAAALAFLAEKKLDGTLITVFEDGRPHASVVTPAVIDGHLWISSRRRLVKVRNVERDPRVTFIAGTSQWAAVEGRARIDDGEGLAERLRLYYRTAAGEHPDWDDYDRAMIRDQRVIIDITPERAYGVGV
ncbi:MAG: PPOX class F420-dependent oxidoreductase [Actinomycetota bacterium]